MAGMPHNLVRPPKARLGDRIAVLSPSFAMTRRPARCGAYDGAVRAAEEFWRA
jgi:hypothetical protein